MCNNVTNIYLYSSTIVLLEVDADLPEHLHPQYYFDHS